MRRLTLVAGLAILLAILLAFLLANPVQAQGTADAAAGVPAVVLVFHPDDGVDPLGFEFAGSDAFAVRYGPLVADKGRFDFPFFVADGVLPIEAIPDPAKPFLSALEGYTQAVERRAGEEAAAVLTLDSIETSGQVLVQVSVTPRGDLSGEDLHLRIAVVEDHVHYQPPPGLTNGVTDHRFTVRAYADLGALDLAAPVNRSHAFALGEGWAGERLSVAAWLQQDAPSPRFDAREVAQATQAPLGQGVVQSDKGVLVEMLSATWCDPCLYGDRAVEDLAVRYGVAEPGSREPEFRYLDLRPRDGVAIAAAALMGIGVAMLARRRP